MVTIIGLHATMRCKLRQVRKEATVAAKLCALIWLMFGRHHFNVHGSARTGNMNYQVLARKWRPKQFSEMVGQQHVLPALIHALEQNRLHHAYLFTGTRGVGKTTVARIFAKCLNCKQGITATPCGTCSATSTNSI